MTYTDNETAKALRKLIGSGNKRISSAARQANNAMRNFGHCSRPEGRAKYCRELEHSAGVLYRAGHVEVADELERLLSQQDS